MNVALLFYLARKKLTQLQHAYTCLFKDYDSKLKSEVGPSWCCTSCSSEP